MSHCRPLTLPELKKRSRNRRITIERVIRFVTKLGFDPLVRSSRKFRDEDLLHHDLLGKIAEKTPENVSHFLYEHAKWVYADAEKSHNSLNSRIDRLLTFTSAVLGITFGGVRLIAEKPGFQITIYGWTGFVLLVFSVCMVLFLKKSVASFGPPSARDLVIAGLDQWTSSMDRLRFTATLSVDLAAFGVREVNQWVARRLTLALTIAALGIVLMLVDAIVFVNITTLNQQKVDNQAGRTTVKLPTTELSADERT